MTNEEAAKELMMAYEDLKNMCYMDCGREAAFNKAREALKAEPCEDAVSRQAILDHIYGVNGLEGLENSNVFEKHYADFIKSLPPVTPQPEIVRCKDCKHRDAGIGFCEGRGWPMQLVPDDGFCDKGKRSEE